MGMDRKDPPQNEFLDAARHGNASHYFDTAACVAHSPPVDAGSGTESLRKMSLFYGRAVVDRRLSLAYGGVQAGRMGEIEHALQIIGALIPPVSPADLTSKSGPDQQKRTGSKT